MATANSKRASKVLLLGVLLGWSATTFLGVRAACDFFTFLLFASVAIVSLAVALWLWIRGPRSVRWIVTVAVISNAPACYGVQVYESARASRKVDQIVGALEQYKHENGSYPPDLEQLRPKYIVELPTASVGFRSYVPSYSAHNGESYVVGYGGQDCGSRFHGPRR